MKQSCLSYSECSVSTFSEDILHMHIERENETRCKAFFCDVSFFQLDVIIIV